MKRVLEILPSPSFGLQWRASPWFITLVVGMGITTDFLIYSIIIPVIPFHLQALGYSDVSSLVGYLLFAYSSGIVLSTPIVAWYSERQNSRKGTLMIGLLALAGSQALFMESREYWIMAIARLLQGISASIVWTAGLALVCDTVPEEKIGRYLGLSMAGLPLGQLIGPPVGGALFDRFGIRGPCVFGIIAIAVDLMFRLLLIERREALVGGFDPAASYGTFDTETDFSSEAERQPLIGRDDSDSEETDYADSLSDRGANEATRVVPHDPISFFQIIKVFFASSRAVAALMNSFVYGILFSCQEPSLPIYLQKIWQLHSSEVGLVFIAAALPAMLSPPVAGWFADRVGTEWVTFFCLLLAIPCWIAVVLPSKLSFFVIAFAFENLYTAAFVAPVTTELALVSRRIRGVGYAHIYGAFNFAVGIGASVGPAIGGEIFERFTHGWAILNVGAVVVIVAASLMVVLFTGERPLARRLGGDRQVDNARGPKCSGAERVWKRRRPDD